MRTLLLAAAATVFFPFAPFAQANTPRTIELTVTKKGFEPNRVKVKKGETVTLEITRKVEKTCATEIVVPGYGIDVDLPLNERVSVTFTPRKTGELTYGCAMDQMLGGVLLVE